MAGVTAPGGGHASRTTFNRGLITICCMVGTLMQALDSTIANVALPYMQGSLSVTFDQITWVLTSYIIAAAIMTAPVGWLAARFGRKNLFIVSLAGFTFMSMLCGAADSLGEIVVFRVFQGMFGAALVPLSQSIMLDIYPSEQRGHAMALWGMGVMVGPILGPTLGGYLTEYYNWRWVFYVNVPFGVMAILGLLLFMPRMKGNQGLQFDWFGFAVLSLGIGALQMMLDRGELKDWFGSGEIITEGVLAGIGFYLFLVHMFTARKPFIPRELFSDWNFIIGVLVRFILGLILVASSALLAPYLEDLANYPVETAGLVMAPRGIGTMIAMFAAGQLVNRTGTRGLMLIGALLLEYSLWLMIGWTPNVSPWTVTWVTTIQGFGMGLVFTPLNVAAFTTLPMALRTDATGMFSLFRNVGSAIGVSITAALLDRVGQVEHSALATDITPFRRLLTSPGAIHRLLDPTTPHGAAMLHQVIDRQTEIIAYVADFKLMMLATLPLIVVVLLFRGANRVPKGEGAAVLE